MPTVDWKGVGLIEFPDDATPEEISQVLSDQEFAIDERFGLKSDPGFWAEFMPDAAERGFRRSIMGFDILRGSNPDLPIIGMSPDEAAIAIREQQARINDIPMSEEARGVLNEVVNEDFFDALGTMIMNPGAAASIITEGLGGSVPVAATTLAAVAVPTLVGAALGSPLGPGGAIVAGTAGTAAGSYAVEYSNTLFDYLASDADVDIMDVDEVAAALSNKDLMKAASDRAVARGIPVAAVDALAYAISGGFSNMVRGARIAAKSGVEVGPDYIRTSTAQPSRLTELAGMTGVETIGGMGGEALAQLSADGKITSPGEIAIEGLAQGALGGPTNLASFLAAEYAAKRQAGIQPSTSTELAVLPGVQELDPDTTDLQAVAQAVAAERSSSVPEDASIREQLDNNIANLGTRINKKQASLNEMRASGKTPDKAARLEANINDLKARMAGMKQQRAAMTGTDFVLVEPDDVDGTPSFGASPTVESLSMPRRARKAVNRGKMDVLLDIVGRSTSKSEAGALKSPELRTVMDSYKSFMTDVKLRKGRLVTQMNDILQPALRQFKVPIFDSRAYDKRADQALGRALHLKPEELTAANINKILDQYKVSDEYRAVFPDMLVKARQFLDTIADDEIASGLQVEKVEGYFPIDMLPILNSRRKRAKAIDVIAKVTGNRSQAETLIQNMLEAVTGQDTELSSFDYLVSRGIVSPGPAKQTFERARTLAPKIRRALIDADLVPTSFYDVMRRRINQSAMAIPIRTRIVPGQKALRSMLNSTDQDVKVGAENLLKVGEVLQGRMPSGNKVPYGYQRPMRGLVSATYLATLGMAGLASLGEIIVLAAHAKPGDAFYAFRKTIPVVMRKLARSFFPHVQKSEAEAALDKYLIYMSAPEMAERFTTGSVIDFTNKVTEKFFLTNLLTQITQATRIAAAFAFDHAINRDVGILQTADKNSQAYRDAYIRMRKLGVPADQMTSMSPEMRQMAVLSGIDQTVMAPDPTTTPLWMRNPYLAPVAMLKSFAFTFGNTIGKQVWDEVVLGEALGGEIKYTKAERAQKAFRYAFMLSMLIGSQMGVEAMRDTIRNWDDEKKDYGEDESKRMLFNAVIATNLLGPIGLLLSSAGAEKFGSTPYESLSGPIAGRFSDFMTALDQIATTGEAKRLIREFLKSVPFVANNPSARRQLEEAILEAIGQ